MGECKMVDDRRSYGWKRDPRIPRAMRASSYNSFSEKGPEGRKIVEGADRL